MDDKLVLYIEKDTFSSIPNEIIMRFGEKRKGLQGLEQNTHLINED